MTEKEQKNIAIKVDDVDKHFFMPTRKRDTLVEFLSNPLSLLRGKNRERLDVLSDISFNVKKGEFLGVIGDNGSGKSTLLKIIAGIYLPSAGRIQVNGRMATFLELGVGFNPELTARENIYLNGIILGMSHKEVERKFDSIVDFSELEKFLDMPLKNFSSGMQVRLAFSIAIKSSSDIYILDEVLAVGDNSFQQKCFDEFKKFRKSKKTIVFVSHALGIVKEFCDRVILIDGGRVIKDGEAGKVVDFYSELTEKRRSAE